MQVNDFNVCPWNTLHHYMLKLQKIEQGTLGDFWLCAEIESVKHIKKKTCIIIHCGPDWVSHCTVQGSNMNLLFHFPGQYFSVSQRKERTPPWKSSCGHLRHIESSELLFFLWHKIWYITSVGQQMWRLYCFKYIYVLFTVSCLSL